jgi:hypothetical protein
MSWSDVLNYAKGLAANHGVDAAKKLERADDGLPFGARVGGVLVVQPSGFIRANINGSIIMAPANPDNVIKGISRLRLDMPGKVHRFYLNLDTEGSDNGAGGGRESFLQVFTDANGDSKEILYCSHFTRMIPETEEDQTAFTGEGGYGLGQYNYSLSREQLLACGIDATTLAGAMTADADGILYSRDIGSSDQDFIAPLQGTETRIDDAIGEHGLKQSIYYMPYVRELKGAGGREYLIITTEIVESRDGDASRRSIHVDFMVGIPLEPERVSVL